MTAIVSEGLDLDLAQISANMILYPRLKEVHGDLDHCVKLTAKKGEPHCMYLEAPTGAGKTWLILHYASLFPVEDTPEGPCTSVFYMLLPATTSPSQVASKALKALGDPAADIGTATQLGQRLAKRIRACRIQLFILDEFHQLMDSESDKVLHKIANWLKVLIKESGVTFLALSASPKAQRVFAENPELSRLFPLRDTLQPFAWAASEPSTITTFHDFVLCAEIVVGVPLTDVLPRVQLLWRIHWATGGVVGNVMSLLFSAAITVEERVRQGKMQGSVITLPVLEETFRKHLMKHVGKDLNPFSDTVGVNFEPSQPPIPKKDVSGTDRANQSSESAEGDPGTGAKSATPPRSGRRRGVSAGDVLTAS